MTGPDIIIEPGEGLDAALEALPNRHGVFLLWARAGEPYLAKTALLRRRLLRLLRRREGASRLVSLRETAVRLECWVTGSSLESSLAMYSLARKHYPEKYREILRLRLPPYVRIVLDNEFPRSQITHHIGRAAGVWYGPFRSRASAEGFESQCLDLFQMRRCQEDLVVSPEHPGCMYGEMGMCLRPCQQVVGADEYRHEVARVVEFLKTDGKSLRDALESARDRWSAEMEFEEAARQHKRIEKLDAVLKLRDELVCELDRLCGVAVTPSAEEGCVDLRFVRRGFWQPVQRFRVAAGSETVSMDARLREMVAAAEWREGSARRRQEHLALLARWFYSSWRDGEWLGFDGLERVPYRRLVRAISRAAAGAPRVDILP